MTFEIGKLQRIYLAMLDRMESSASLFETRNREGIFSPALTMWLMINGRAKGQRSLMDALDSLVSNEASEVAARSNTRKLRVIPVSMNSGGLSRARERLSLDLVKRVSFEIVEHLLRDLSPTLWHGRRVFLCDGTIIALTRTKEHVEAFRPTRNQHGSAYTPNFLCLCCHELFSGIALTPRYGAYRGENARSEPGLFYEVLEDLPHKSLIVMDRNFGIFPVAYAAARKQHHILVRLTASRAKGFGVEKGPFVDKKVRWEFGTSRSTEQLQIPKNASLDGRFIKWTVERKGCRPLELLFFTNSSQSAEELANLYLQRERIENDIRTLKHTIGMERLFAESPDGIAKELILGVTAYNLLRAIISEAARELGLEPRQISFTRAAKFSQIFSRRILEASSQQERLLLQQHFLTALKQTRIPNRKKRRIEPRKLAHDPKKYTLMKHSRAQEQIIAEETLAKHGNRGYYTSVTRKY